MQSTDSDPGSLITQLGLEPHPEGGHFAETWRDEHSSAIYYLLRAGEESAWHRVIGRSEVWHHYAGSALELAVSDDEDEVRSHVLGTDLHAGERPQAVVPAGSWQSAKLLGEWTLVGCTVSPPFTYEPFELAPAGWSPGRFGPLVSPAGWPSTAVMSCSSTSAGTRTAVPVATPTAGHIPGAVWIDLDDAPG